MNRKSTFLLSFIFLAFISVNTWAAGVLDRLPAANDSVSANSNYLAIYETTDGVDSNGLGELPDKTTLAIQARDILIYVLYGNEDTWDLIDISLLVHLGFSAKASFDYALASYKLKSARSNYLRFERKLAFQIDSRDTFKNVAKQKFSNDRTDQMVGGAGERLHLRYIKQVEETRKEGKPLREALRSAIKDFRKAKRPYLWLGTSLVMRALGWVGAVVFTEELGGGTMSDHYATDDGIIAFMEIKDRDEANYYIEHDLQGKLKDRLINTVKSIFNDSEEEREEAYYNQDWSDMGSEFDL